MAVAVVLWAHAPGIDQDLGGGGQEGEEEGWEKLMGLSGRRIVTWNVLRVALREQNRNRLRRVVGFIERNGWEVVLMTKMKAEERSIIWLGEDEKRVAIIHSERAAVVLRGGVV